MSLTDSTRKLYFDDAFRLSFEAATVTEGSFRGQPSVVLKETCFYPESGGQLGDVGTLRLRGGSESVDVVDTQIDDDGVIHHLVADAAHALGVLRAGPIEGAVEPRRRARQRLQHSSQHLLSSAFDRAGAGAATASARLGAVASTIDLAVPSLIDAEVHRAEDLVNAVVREDLAVRAFFPSPEELAALPLRRAPKVSTDVRVVVMGEAGAPFDVTPCGGTHVSRTGQIGCVRVTGVERYKGMMRVTFLAGEEALLDARWRARMVTDLGRELSCAPAEIPQVLEKLRGELKAERDVSARLRRELAALDARGVVASAPPADAHERFTFVEFRGGDLAFLRALVEALTEEPAALAVVVGTDLVDGHHPILVQRGAARTFDCGAFMKRASARLGLRGGGSKARAEGRLPAGILRETLVKELTLPEA